MCFGLYIGLSDLDAYISDPSKLVGKVGTDDSFMSCGNCRNTNFGSKPVCLNIYCPKGTQMTYAEPFSAFGSSHDNGDYCPGKKWNGTYKPTTTGENETISFITFGLCSKTSISIYHLPFVYSALVILLQVLTTKERRINYGAPLL